MDILDTKGGKRVIIIIDEAQELPYEILEELRALSNLETEKEKLNVTYAIRHISGSNIKTSKLPLGIRRYAVLSILLLSVLALILTPVLSARSLIRDVEERADLLPTFQEKEEGQIKIGGVKKDSNRKIVARLQQPSDRQVELPVMFDDFTTGKGEQLPTITQERPPAVSDQGVRSKRQEESKKKKEIRGDASKSEIRNQKSEIQEEASHKDVYLYMARTFENKNDYSGALRSYEKALEVDPENYVIMNNISSILIHLEIFERSIEYSKKALAVKKDHVFSLINLGIAYIKLENFTKGEGYLLRALSIDPINKYALFNTALLYEKIGDYDKANRSFYRLSKMGDVKSGYLGLARIAEKQDRVSDAKAFYKAIMSGKGIDSRMMRFVNQRIMVLELAQKGREK